MGFKTKYNWDDLKELGFRDEDIQHFIESGDLTPENWELRENKADAFIQRNVLFVLSDIKSLVRNLTNVYRGISGLQESVKNGLAALRYSIDKNSAILERLNQRQGQLISPMPLKVIEDELRYTHQYLLNQINKYHRNNPGDQQRLMIADMKLPLVKLKGEWFVESESEYRRQLSDMGFRGMDKLRVETRK